MLLYLLTILTCQSGVWETLVTDGYLVCGYSVCVCFTVCREVSGVEWSGVEWK